MKRLITLLICISLIIGVTIKFDTITNYVEAYFERSPKILIEEKNKYYKDINYQFVSNTDNFTPYNYQELLNIIYTVLNSGYDTFTFYCPNEYEDCINDIAKISKQENDDILTTIGNYISPFNNFTSLKILYDTAGEITLKIEHLYSDDYINKVNDKIDELWDKLITEDMTDEDIIITFHDYIINNTKYDILYEDELKEYIRTHTDSEGNIINELPIEKRTTYDSSRAMGSLFQGYAICSGYTDVMAIILDRLNLPNFKVASDTHVWNVVYIKDGWKHLDLTWDDPVSEDRTKDTLLHKFYLIDTETLEDFKIADHNYDKSIYLEIK